MYQRTNQTRISISAKDRNLNNKWARKILISSSKKLKWSHQTTCFKSCEIIRITLSVNTKNWSNLTACQGVLHKFISSESKDVYIKGLVLLAKLHHDHTVEIFFFFFFFNTKELNIIMNEKYNIRVQLLVTYPCH